MNESASGQLGGKDDVRQVQGPRLDTSSPDFSAACASRRWIPCLSCWLADKFGTPYPKAHTGIGPRCPRWPYA